MPLCTGRVDGHTCSGHIYRCGNCGNTGCIITKCRNCGFKSWACTQCGRSGNVKLIEASLREEKAKLLADEKARLLAHEKARSVAHNKTISVQASSSSVARSSEYESRYESKYDSGYEYGTGSGSGSWLGTIIFIMLLVFVGFGFKHCGIVTCVRHDYTGGFSSVNVSTQEETQTQTPSSIVIAQSEQTNNPPSEYVNSDAGESDKNGEKHLIDSNRFKVSNEGVVTDTKTGLEWIAQETDVFVSYDNVEQAIGQSKTAGGSWRMPTLDELETLYNEGIRRNKMAPFKITGYPIWAKSIDPSSQFADQLEFDTGFSRSSLKSISTGQSLAVRSIKENHSALSNSYESNKTLTSNKDKNTSASVVSQK